MSNRSPHIEQEMSEDNIRRVAIAFVTNDYKNLPGMKILAPNETMRAELMSILSREFPDDQAAISAEIDEAFEQWKQDPTGQQIHNAVFYSTMDSIGNLLGTDRKDVSITLKEMKKGRRLRRIAQFIGDKVEALGTTVE